MVTCGFCGSELEINYCSFCDMELEKRYILKDGQRLAQKELFLGFPNQNEVFQSTKELMKKETIDLFCLLREARRLRAEVFKLRKIKHDAERDLGKSNNDLKQLDEATYEEYEHATRKVWVIENIIKDRLGYYPKRISKSFINGFVDRIEDSEEKIMIINK